MSWTQQKLDGKEVQEIQAEAQSRVKTGGAWIWRNIQHTWKTGTELMLRDFAFISDMDVTY